MFMHLHPASTNIRETSELLTADASELSFKSVVNALVRLLRRDGKYLMLTIVSSSFATQNIPNKMYLVEACLLNLDSRDDRIWICFGSNTSEVFSQSN